MARPNFTEKEAKTIVGLFESGLSGHPSVARLLKGAFATGNFSELDHYLNKNQGLVEKMVMTNLLTGQLARQNPFYPFPAGEELKKLQGPIRLGIINVISGIPIYFGIPPEITTMHGMIAGRTGTGKTWSNANFLEQLIKHGKTHVAPYNVVIPDIKIFYRRLLGRVEGLKVITFDNFIFNPLEIPQWMDPRDFIFLFSKVFAADNLLGVPSEGILIDALSKLFRDRGIFDGSQNYPVMSDLLRLVTHLQNDKVLGLRYRDIYETLLNRLRPYAFLEENFGKRRAIRHEVFTTENVVLEMPPDKVSDYMHNFLISFIIYLTYVRNMTQGLRGDNLMTLYLIDEARKILKASREHTALEWIEPSINEPITKGREFGLAIWMCSQEMASFSRLFRSNTLTKICFPLTDGEDVSEVKRSFSLTDEQANYLFQLPRQRVAICNYGDFPRSFLLVVEELKGLEKTPTDHEIKEAMADFYNEILPKKDAEQIEITETLPPKSTYSEPEIDALIMLRHLAKNPFLNYGDLIRELDLTPARGDKARARMVNSGFAKIHSITLRKGKPGEYFELTEEAYRKFGGKPPIGKGGFEHLCFSHAVKNCLEAQEFGVRLEGMMEGSQKAFDVLAWKTGEGMIGYEITLHFQNLVQNLREDLRTTVKKVVVVCRNKDELEKAKWIVKKELGELSRLDFKTIFEFTQKTKDAS